MAESKRIINKTEMLKMAGRYFILLIIIVLTTGRSYSQISPGELSSVHSKLEGIGNCTKCHVLGDKQTNDKCLECHTEIAEKINVKRGYHASVEVAGKQCSSCHSEHNGKDFPLVRLDEQKFNHGLTGFRLSVPHAKKGCKDCHNAKNISDPRLKSRKSTFLGLNTDCLNCHEDYHMRTLSSACLNCHIQDAFKPASNFNHDNARFRLNGKHRSVECSKCHKITMSEGRKFQQFSGLQYVNCASCHKDPHKNLFGQNCRQCHSEESFKVVQGIQKFDHNKTAFKLEGKHMIVNCKSCHKGRLTDPLKHDKCTDCHSDYHNGQFTRGKDKTDCSKCHNVSGFTQVLFTIDQHNQGVFPLKGAHLATPCYDCHKKKDKWNFRMSGIKCNDCHVDIHKTLIDEKYYPSGSCIACHNEVKWSDVSFDHSKTTFPLAGAHKSVNCRGCHFKTYSTNEFLQTFAGLSTDCSECHKDNHRNQFDINGTTTCTRCHSNDNWKASAFDHNSTAFKLEGKHANVACKDCHKQQKIGSEFYVLYKIKEFKCESCHF